MSSRKVAAGLVAGAALCIVALSACGGSGSTDDPGPGGVGGTGVGVGGSVSTTTTTGDADGGSGGDGGGGGGGGATTTHPAAITFPSTAEQYTRNAVDAWASEDVATLDQYESQDGILHQMLTCDGCYNTQFSLAADCQGAAGSSYCRYFNLYGDDLLLRVVNASLGQARALDGGSTFEPTSFPADDQAYAAEAVQAWSEGNDNRLKLLTADDVTSAQIDALGVQRGNWTFDTCQGAAGSTYCQFTSGGHVLAFKFNNQVSGAGIHDRIIHVQKQA